MDEEVQAAVSQVRDPVTPLQPGANECPGDEVHLAAGVGPGQPSPGERWATVDQELGVRCQGDPVVDVRVDPVEYRSDQITLRRCI